MTEIDPKHFSQNSKTNLWKISIQEKTNNKDKDEDENNENNEQEQENENIEDRFQPEEPVTDKDETENVPEMRSKHKAEEPQCLNLYFSIEHQCLVGSPIQFLSLQLMNCEQAYTMTRCL